MTDAAIARMCEDEIDDCHDCQQKPCICVDENDEFGPYYDANENLIDEATNG